MLQFHNAHKIEASVIWKLGEFVIIMIRNQVVLKDSNKMLDGTKIVWSWVVCMN